MSAVTPAAPAIEPAVSVRGPSPAIRDLRVQRRGNATAVTLQGTSRLIATSINEPKEGRVGSSSISRTSRRRCRRRTNVGQGPVERVRIGFDPSAPLMTQVSVDLSRAAAYRVESSPDGNDMTLVFDETAADPFSALQSRDSGSGTRGSAVPAAPARAVAADLRTPEPESPTIRPSAAPVQRVAAAQAPAPAAPVQRSAAPAQAVQPEPVARHRHATPATRSALTSRAPTCAPCCGRSRKSAG